MVIKVTKDTFIEFNEETQQTKVIDKAAIQADLANAKTRLNEVAKPPTNAEILAWAKSNYPYMDTSKEVESLNKVVADNEAILERIKNR